MIEFRPGTDEKTFDYLNTENLISNTITYTAYENGEKVGSCAGMVKDTFVSIVYLHFSDDKPYIGEGLIKSVLNTAASRGAYIAVCSEKVKANYTLPYGFKLQNEKYTGEIPEILMGKCHKFGNL